MAGKENSMLLSPFEERAVAFLDVLGFSDLISRAQHTPSVLNSLHGLRTVLDVHVRWDNQNLDATVPVGAKPKYIFISDSIIVSAPLQSGKYNGLAVVAAKSIEISLKLLEMGYLLRGGISVGPTWHDDHNIFGTGYINAYKTETKAIHPRILLSEDATTHSRAATHFGVQLHELGLFLNRDNSIILNTFNSQFIRNIERYGRLEEAFGQYRNWISQQLSEANAGSSARSKWEWTAISFNEALRRESVGSVKPFDSIPLPLLT